MSTADLPKQYDPRDAQGRWYRTWEDRGYFRADPSGDRPPYTIVIPPPNVTGALHLGHALNNTIQDILIRWRRMQGYDALWMPGTDHAGIATQAVVETRLRRDEGKTRRDVGRDELVRRIWAWKDEYEARILGQLRAMGCSCDWSRTRFTLDATCAAAVRETFFRLFQDGKIFRGKRLVNWDVQLRTAVADDEIEYVEQAGSIWTLRYPVEGSDETLMVATTRPETMLGDTAVAVHPSDDRYRRLIGRTLRLPLVGRSIPIVADAILVDPEFGTGCIKVTPAHDPKDYACGLRHGLEMINLLNPDGTLNDAAGPYAGLDLREGRKRVVADLEAAGALVEVKPHQNRIGLSDRSKTPIEPYLSDQWFVEMGELAQDAIDAVNSGDVAIHPPRYARSYLDWLGEKRDWCISRQLWWGHRIPVWRPGDDWGTREQIEATFEYLESLKLSHPGTVAVIFPETEARATGEDGEELTGFTIQVCLSPGTEDVAQRLEALGLVQDPDVLDTWFSSALWPHSTLGWPEATPELAKYYPTSVLSTARDILTLWVARMVMLGRYNNEGKVPFRDVYIHPVIQDGQGRRMSKSLGNGIDPVDIIDLYGADTLRFALAQLATETQDIRLPVVEATLPDGRKVNSSERFELARTFPNKVWNMARFALMNLEGFAPRPLGPADLAIEDRWILGALSRTAAETTADLEAFRFADATRRLRDFTWNDVCDWYVEFIKDRLRDPEARPVAQNVLAGVLDGLCRLLHPIVPFLTESIWQALGAVAPARGLPAPAPAEESACIAAWPAGDVWPIEAEAEAAVGRWREVISAIRNLKAERDVPKGKKVAPIVVAAGPLAATLRAGEAAIRSLVNASSLAIVESVEKPANAAVAVLADAEVILPLDGLVDPEAESARLLKDLANVRKQLPGIRAKLGNEAFLARAPADVVAGLRAKLEELEAQEAAILRLLGPAAPAA